MANETKPVDITEKHKYDIKRLSTQELVHYCAELVIEVKKLRHSIEAHDTESKTFYNNYQASQKQTARAEEQIDIIGKAISPAYTLLANNGHLKTKTLEEKTNIIIQDLLAERKKNVEAFLDYEEKLKNNKIVLDEMKAHYLQTIKDKNETTENTTKADDFTNKDFETFAGSHTEQKTAEQLVTQVDTGDYISTLRTYSKKDLLESLNDNAKEIIRIIGEEGLSEMTEITARAVECGVPSSSIDKIMTDLSDAKQILSKDYAKSLKVTGVGKRVYALTNDVGKQLYKSLFGKNPVLSEKEIMIKENDNIDHGYSIKDVAKVLTERGYTNVSYDRAKNTFKITDTKKWIPDITCYDLSGKMQYYEVEMAKTNDEDFIDKLEKANVKASSLNVVVGSDFKVTQYKAKVEKWLSRKDRSQVSLTVTIYTFQQLANKDDGLTISSKLVTLQNKIEANENSKPPVAKLTKTVSAPENTKKPSPITEEIVKDGD